MLYQRDGYPDSNEVVICTVVKIWPGSVLVKLDEYDKKGMINIGEISPGRIRNIRDYVTLNKKIICKVLRVRGEYIDLSLRRVSENERRRKADEMKQEQKAEKTIELLAKKINKKPQQLYEKISSKAFEEYLYIFELFQEIGEDKKDIKVLKLDAKTSKILDELIKERFKPAIYEIKAKFSLSVYEENGVDIIKKHLSEIEKIKNKDIIDLKLSYVGAGDYSLKISTENGKEGEKFVESIGELLEEKFSKYDAKVSFNIIS